MDKPDEHFAIPDSDELVRLYSNDVFRVCNYYLGKRCLAEDAFQDVFIRAIQKKDQFTGSCPVKFWLLTIAKNICKDYLKSSWAQRVGSYEQMNEDTGESAEKSSGGSLPKSGTGVYSGAVDGRHEEDEFFDALDPCGDLWNAIMKCPPQMKDVILLKYYYDMDNAAIAKQLGITESTVRSRLFRVRNKLKGFKGKCD